MHDKISDAVYRQEIMELYRSPENYGILENHDKEHTGSNASCGDEITVQLMIRDGKIENAKFSGSGCVISIVASSMLVNRIKGMKTEDVLKMGRDEMMDLFETKISPGRMKCLLLPLEVVGKALNE